LDRPLKIRCTYEGEPDCFTLDFIENSSSYKEKKIMEEIPIFGKYDDKDLLIGFRILSASKHLSRQT
jgi:hypothetical protein